MNEDKVSDVKNDVEVNVENGKKERTKELLKELSLKGLHMRHDSRLCFSYINNDLGKDWNVHRVVQECCTMHWLYNYTAYPCKMDEAYMYFSTILTSGRTVHEFIKQNVQPHIKSQTILQHGGIPKTWPWLIS